MTELPLSIKHLSSHIAAFGDTGVGKTLLLAAIMSEIERRGDVAVVWDPDKQLSRWFGSVARGDWFIDPTIAVRQGDGPLQLCPYWAMEKEYADEGEAYALATCFLPDNPNVKDPFWNNSARGLLTVLSALHHPTAVDLSIWCADDIEIDRRVVGTEYERILTQNAPGMRSSIISHLNQIALPLRMMPTHHHGRRIFTVRDYCHKRNSWVFITSAPQYAKVMEPLHTFFLSSMIMRLVAMGNRLDLPRVWIIIEEASTIMVQEFHLGLIRLRKTGNPVAYSIQNFADLKAVFADRAETIFSQAYYKIFMRLGSDESAKKVSASIGGKRIEKYRVQYMHHDKRPGYRRTWTIEPETLPVIPDYELLNLDDREAFIVKPKRITKVRLPILKRRSRIKIEEVEIPPMIRRLPTSGDVEPVAKPAQSPPLLLGNGVF